MAKKISEPDPKILKKLRELCLAFPEATETMTWGNPHFRVANKIFCGCSAEDGKTTIGFKLEMGHAQKVLEDSRFCPAPYVGHKGWVSMDLSKGTDWKEVKELLKESYYLIAPKRLAKLMLEQTSTTK